MAEKTYRVSVGGTVRTYREGTCFGEIAADFHQNETHPIVLVKANGRLRELHRRLKEDTRLEMVTTGDPIGSQAYGRSMIMLFLKSVYEEGGQAVDHVILHFSVPSGFYFTVSGKVRTDGAFLERVSERMKRTAEENIPIEKRTVSTSDARRLFRHYGMTDKDNLFRYRLSSYVNIYRMGNFEDYFYGYMLWKTGELKYFRLVPYQNGVVMVLPGVKQPEVVPEFVPSPKIFAVQKKSEEWEERLNISTVGRLNECISRGHLDHIRLVAEAIQEGTISDIAGEIARRGNVKFVCIAGPSSSGKTTFSRRLSIQLTAHGMTPHPISLDNYYRNRAEIPFGPDGQRDFERLEALDLELFHSQMMQLLKGEQIELPHYNFATGNKEYKGEYLKLQDHDILVIEGIHGLNEKLSRGIPEEAKFKIYISALTQLNIDEHNRVSTTDGRLVRRIVRDYRTRNTSAQETIAMWDSVRRGEEKYIFPYQEEADVMFNSALIYEMSVLKTYAVPLLYQIPEDAPEFITARHLLKFLDYFVAIPSEDIPNNSILREFIGGSCFDV